MGPPPIAFSKYGRRVNCGDSYCVPDSESLHEHDSTDAARYAVDVERPDAGWIGGKGRGRNGSCGWGPARTEKFRRAVCRYVAEPDKSKPLGRAVQPKKIYGKKLQEDARRELNENTFIQE